MGKHNYRAYIEAAQCSPGHLSLVQHLEIMVHVKQCPEVEIITDSFISGNCVNTGSVKTEAVKMSYYCVGNVHTL